MGRPVVTTFEEAVAEGGIAAPRTPSLGLTVTAATSMSIAMPESRWWTTITLSTTLREGMICVKGRQDSNEGEKKDNNGSVYSLA